MRRIRIVSVTLPVQIGARDGLAYTLWMPDPGATSGSAATPPGGVVILHGAGSCKESHHDFARAAVAAGLGAICFDQRGHGETGGVLDARATRDIATMAAVLRERLGDADAPIALRGSSMGGYLALAGARPARAAAVVAICPAPSELLLRGLRSGAFEFDADVPALEALLAEHDLTAVASDLDIPVLLLHAEGDERVPVEHSRALREQLRHEQTRLITVPGGHHRSVQHDGELQATSLRFIERAITAPAGPGA